jgi:hypothetical protein
MNTMLVSLLRSGFDNFACRWLFIISSLVFCSMLGIYLGQFDLKLNE